MRSMVEGYVQSGAAYDLLCPSTTLRPRGKQRAPRVPLTRSLPLPRWGRIVQDRNRSKLASSAAALL